MEVVVDGVVVVVVVVVVVGGVWEKPGPLSWSWVRSIATRAFSASNARKLAS